MRTHLIGSAILALLFVPRVSLSQQVVLRHYTINDGLAHNSVTRVFEDSRGFIWFTTADGLTRFDGYRFLTYRAADGLPASMLTGIGETQGALWVSARDGAAVRLNDGPRGPRFFAQRIAQRIASEGITTVPPTGPVFATIARRVFDDRAGETAPLVLRGTSAIVTHRMEDRRGTLWIATSGQGVFAVPREPILSYTAADELPDEHVVRMIESRDGRIYAVTRRGGVAELKEDGVEVVPGSLFAPFHTMGRRIVQDDRGVWWFHTDAGLFSTPGPALSFTNAQRVIDATAAPAERRTPSFVDSRGWTWDPLHGGGVSLCRSRAESAGCVDYAKAEGVGSAVTSIAEDAFGRIYLGTTKGLIRFDAETRTWQPIPSAGRLAGSSVTHCMRDSGGRMWIATTTGVSVIVPRPRQRLRAPQVYLTALHAAQTELAAPSRGITTLQQIQHGTRAGSLRIEFVAPGVETEGAVRYEHRLTPLETHWSTPTTDRAVVYSQLPAGSYEFMVRAVGLDGGGGTPASVPVVVVGPARARWWWMFGGAAMLFAGGLLRQLQRAHRRRDLAGVPLTVLGGMEQQTEDGGGHRRTADGSWLGQR